MSCIRIGLTTDELSKKKSMKPLMLAIYYLFLFFRFIHDYNHALFPQQSIPSSSINPTRLSLSLFPSQHTSTHQPINIKERTKLSPGYPYTAKIIVTLSQLSFIQLVKRWISIREVDSHICPACLFLARGAGYQKWERKGENKVNINALIENLWQMEWRRRNEIWNA